jgi:catalase
VADQPTPPTEPTPPTRSGKFARLVAVVVLLLAVVGAFAYTGGWFAPNALTPARMIDTFEQVNGVHSGFRRNHAKGICVSGYFESNGRGVALSKAIVFAAGHVPVIGRFALAGGQPYTADATRTVRSMALLFRLPGGEEWRTGMNNIPVFPVNTPEAFYEQLLASAPDPATGKPDPAKMQAFLSKHPESAAAIGLIKAQSVSSGFANSTFNSLNAFRLVAANGQSIPVRWSMTPAQPVDDTSATQPALANKNDLFDALIARVHGQPLQWHLVIALGGPNDSTKDATIAWPADRERVDVGTLTIDHVESEDGALCRDINFDPLVLPTGIEPSDDPLLSARSAAYAQSFTRRAGEKKLPSAVTPAEAHP